MEQSRFLPVLYILSKLSIIFIILLFIPSLVSWFYNDGYFLNYILILLGLLLFLSLFVFSLSKYKRNLNSSDGFLLGTLMWLFCAFFASIEIYYLFPNISFTNAYLTSISALTTTGFAILDDFYDFSPTLIFLIHYLNWIGGIGIIILTILILPALGGGVQKLYNRNMLVALDKGKLNPRINQIAKYLWLVYIAFTAILFFSFYFIGIDWFDAICYAMSCISLSGGDINYNLYDSSIINNVELILCLGMLFSAVSFITHISALQNRSLKTYFKDIEVVVSLIFIIISILVLSIYFWANNSSSLFATIRHVAFNFLSITLTAGYANTDYANWPVFIMFLMIFFTNFFCNSSSTGGGIKTIRFVVLFKFMFREIINILHPRAIYKVKVNNNIISEKLALSVLTFIFVYISSIILITFIMMITGLDIVSSLSFTLGSITNSGLAIGIDGKTIDFSMLNNIQKWISGFTMLLGRMELYSVFILFSPSYWKDY